MKGLMVSVLAVVACKESPTESKAAPISAARPVAVDDATAKWGAASAWITAFGNDAYAPWLDANPSRNCPADLTEVMKFAKNKNAATLDPWGHAFRIKCDPAVRALHVISDGADGKPDTDDDVDGSLKAATPAGPAAPAPPPAPPRRGGIDERHALAKSIQAQGFTVRTTGADDTTLELAFRGACKAKNLAESVSEGGQAMVESGFVTLKCIGGEDSIALLDEKGESAAGVAVSAKWLFKDYEDNEIAADSRYRNKTFRVSGRIVKIAKDVLDHPYVELATANQFEGVQASFESEAPLVALKKGQQVTLRCTGRGMMMGNPQLDSCSVE